ncbi:hypothetical protein [Nannocystis pusilla]|uniref:hypothetical protein n=1 Tax=Nannocystis pusilla TaxID=889268 RepID=UPI003BF1350B
MLLNRALSQAMMQSRLTADRIEPAADVRGRTLRLKRRIHVDVRSAAPPHRGQLGDASLIPWLRPLLADHECPPGLIPISEEVAEAIEELEHSSEERDPSDD